MLCKKRISFDILLLVNRHKLNIHISAYRVVVSLIFVECVQAYDYLPIICFFPIFFIIKKKKQRYIG